MKKKNPKQGKSVDKGKEQYLANKTKKSNKRVLNKKKGKKKK